MPDGGHLRSEKQNRIAELPRKKTAPEVQTLPLYWLIVRNPDSAILLEKRPAKGIWGRAVLRAVF